MALEARAPREGRVGVPARYLGPPGRRLVGEAAGPHWLHSVVVPRVDATRAALVVTGWAQTFSGFGVWGEDARSQAGLGRCCSFWVLFCFRGALGPVRDWQGDIKGWVEHGVGDENGPDGLLP